MFFDGLTNTGTTIDTVDLIAIQRFYLGYQLGPSILESTSLVL